MTIIRVLIEIDGKKAVDVELGSAVFNMGTEWQEVRTNPAMFAALAGAPPDVVASLPGETVDHIAVRRDFELRGSITRFLP